MAARLRLVVSAARCKPQRARQVLPNLATEHSGRCAGGQRLPHGAVQGRHRLSHKWPSSPLRRRQRQALHGPRGTASTSCGLQAARSSQNPGTQHTHTHTDLVFGWLGRRHAARNRDPFVPARAKPGLLCPSPATSARQRSIRILRYPLALEGVRGNLRDERIVRVRSRPNNGEIDKSTFEIVKVAPPVLKMSSRHLRRH